MAKTGEWSLVVMSSVRIDNIGLWIGTPQHSVTVWRHVDANLQIRRGEREGRGKKGRGRKVGMKGRREGETITCCYIAAVMLHTEQKTTSHKKDSRWSDFSAIPVILQIGVWRTLYMSVVPLFLCSVSAKPTTVKGEWLFRMCSPHSCQNWAPLVFVYSTVS